MNSTYRDASNCQTELQLFEPAANLIASLTYTYVNMLMLISVRITI